MALARGVALAAALAAVAPLRRRFSDFKALHHALGWSLEADYVGRDSMPSKHLFSFSPLTWFDSMDRDFIERRQYWLGLWLRLWLGLRFWLWLWFWIQSFWFWFWLWWWWSYN